MDINAAKLVYLGLIGAAFIISVFALVVIEKEK
jgi:hypothetical protein